MALLASDKCRFQIPPSYTAHQLVPFDSAWPVWVLGPREGNSGILFDIEVEKEPEVLLRVFSLTMVFFLL